MNSKNALTRIPTAEEFKREILETLATGFEAVGKKLVAILDVKPSFKQELMEVGFDSLTLDRLVALGKGEILPELLWNNRPAAIRLIALSIADQKNAVENGIEVLDPDETNVRRIPPNDVTLSQTHQVFDGARMRSAAEQRTWMRKQKSKLRPPEAVADFIVKKDCVIIRRPGRYSKRQLIQWFSEMG